jgi:hypothetical protein
VDKGRTNAARDVDFIERGFRSESGEEEIKLQEIITIRFSRKSALRSMPLAII